MNHQLYFWALQIIEKITDNVDNDTSSSIIV